MKDKLSDALLRKMIASPEPNFIFDSGLVYARERQLARDLLAARRALRKAQKLVADAVRLGAIDQMYESRFGDVLSRALGSRPAKQPRRKA